ncbi:MAG: DNA-deoxyinosine glycosylase, partial [Arenicellales bacterium]
ASLEKQQYYGHPRNAFWPLMAAAHDFELQQYTLNIEALKQHKIAVWDVLAGCERKGSLDSAIIKGSEVINPLPEFLNAHPSIHTIGLNGGAAAQLFKRHCLNLLQDERKVFNLPSTSPAHASMTFTQKCIAWQALFSH